MTEAVQSHHCTRPWYMRPPVWLGGIVVVGLLVFAIVETTGGPAPIPYGTFLDQLDAGNVASVILRGTEIDGHLKHPVAAGSGSTAADTFRSRMPDFGDPSLIAEMRKQHAALDVASSSSWTRLLAGIPLPMWLFLGFILVAGIVRFARGSKAQSDSAVPMHPMQGLIGLASGLFGKQEPSGSPPTGDGNATRGK